MRNDKFFFTSDWVILRESVMATYGKKCMRCGSFKEIQADHIKPRSKYPDLTLSFDNMQVLCRRCNFAKGDHDETDYRGGNFEVVMESEPYVRIYQTPSNRRLMCSLSDKSTRLFMWMLWTRNGTNNAYKLDKLRYMKQCGIKSPNTFSNAVKELVEKKILTRTKKKDVFKVNPTIVYLHGEKVNSYDSIGLLEKPI